MKKKRKRRLRQQQKLLAGIFGLALIGILITVGIFKGGKEEQQPSQPQEEIILQEPVKVTHVRASYSAPEEQHEHRVQQITAQLRQADPKQHKAVFLSMYPTDSYDMSLFANWRALPTHRIDMVLEDDRELAACLDYLAGMQDRIPLVFLGFAPEKITGENGLSRRILPYLKADEKAKVKYEIYWAYPCVEELLELPQRERNDRVDGYQAAMKPLLKLKNIKIFYAGDKEWLVCNGSNYAEPMSAKEGPTKMLLAYYFKNQYVINSSNIQERFSDTRKLIRKWAESGYYEGKESQDGVSDPTQEDTSTIVFFGDSVFGNFSDSMAITSLVEYYTGREVINCGYGGAAAAEVNESTPSFMDILTALETGDVSWIGEIIPAHDGLLAYREKLNEKAVIFISFGTNDYISQVRLKNDDTHDIKTYMGAIRTCIEKLRTLAPNARIVLLNSSPIYMFQYGKVKRGPKGEVYTDYTKAVLEIAQEYKLDYIDIYNDLGIEGKDVVDYLQDEIHLNEQGRFMMAELLMNKLKELK